MAFLVWSSSVPILPFFVLTLIFDAEANRVAPFSLGVPVVGITAGMVVLGEQITHWQWAGIALIVAALLCVMFGEKIWGKSS